MIAARGSMAIGPNFQVFSTPVDYLHSGATSLEVHPVSIDREVFFEWVALH